MVEFRTSLSVDAYRCHSYGEDSNYGNLANAIILKSIEDYKDALVGVEKLPAMVFKYEFSKKPEDRKKRKKLQRKLDIAQVLVNDCEHFFKGDWFGALANELDGQDIIRIVKSKTLKSLRNPCDDEREIFINEALSNLRDL